MEKSLKYYTFGVLILIFSLLSNCSLSNTPKTQFLGWSVIINKEEAMALSVSQDHPGGKLHHFRKDGDNKWQKKGIIDFYPFLPEYRSGVSFAHNDQYIAIGCDAPKNKSGKVLLFNKNSMNKQPEFIMISPHKQKNDLFGWCTAMNSGNIFIGAPGINKNQGIVYVYSLQNLNQPLTEIHFQDKSTGNYISFGSAICADDKKVVIGTPDKDPPGTNPDNNNAISRSGGAYLYQQNSGSWIEKDKLHEKIPSQIRYLELGRIVKESDETVLVCSFNQAFLFEESGTGDWLFKMMIKPSVPENDLYLMSSSIYHSNLILAYQITDPYQKNRYALYLYQKINGTWSESDCYRFTGRDSRDLTGYSIDIYDNQIIVGALGDLPYSPDPEKKDIKESGEILFFEISENRIKEKILESQ